MAGTFTIKSLADGQLGAVKAALYTVGASTQTIIKTITLVNTDTNARTVNLYICVSGGTSRRIIPKDMSLDIKYCFIFDDELTLEAGDKIEGDASVANKVDYVINGVEET